MKKIGEFTARGSLQNGSNFKINLFDGRFDTAHKIVDFKISTDNVTDVQATAAKVTMTRKLPSRGELWDWGDNNEIAWAFAKIGAGTSQVSHDVDYYIDPENLLVEDCWVQVYTSDAATDNVNYMITFEKYEISEALGATSMARDRSGSSGSNWIQ